MLVPAIFASAVLVFADVIDDFILVRYLSGDSSTETVSIKVYNTARAAPTPALNALTTLLLAASLVAVDGRGTRLTVGSPAARSRSGAIDVFAGEASDWLNDRSVRQIREGGEMPLIPPAPLDQAQLELSLAPFGSSRMRPVTPTCPTTYWRGSASTSSPAGCAWAARPRSSRAGCAPSRSATTASC